MELGLSWLSPGTNDGFPMDNNNSHAGTVRRCAFGDRPTRLSYLSNFLFDECRWEGATLDLQELNKIRVIGGVMEGHLPITSTGRGGNICAFEDIHTEGNERILVATAPDPYYNDLHFTRFACGPAQVCYDIEGPKQALTITSPVGAINGVLVRARSMTYSSSIVVVNVDGPARRPEIWDLDDVSREKVASITYHGISAG